MTESVVSLISKELPCQGNMTLFLLSRLVLVLLQAEEVDVRLGRSLPASSPAPLLRSGFSSVMYHAGPERCVLISQRPFLLTL